MSRTTRRSVLAGPTVVGDNGWRVAEEKYRDVLDRYLAEGATKRIDKDAAVEIARARARADKRLDTCLHRLVD
ncbi:MAG TPA: hypothetical protein VIJ41_12425 [Candidatus Nanopelagicales bacterium]